MGANMAAVWTGAAPVERAEDADDAMDEALDEATDEREEARLLMLEATLETDEDKEASADEEWLATELESPLVSEETRDEADDRTLEMAEVWATLTEARAATKKAEVKRMFALMWFVCGLKE
jgi:hypothetical protein